LAKDREEQERKALEERLFQLYLNAAENVPRTNIVNLIVAGIAIYLLLSCLFIVLSGDPFRNGGNGDCIASLAGIITLTMVGLYASRISQKAKKQIAALNALLPNFDKFYAEWLKHKKAQEEKEALWALFAAGFAIAAAAAARERRISEIEEGVRRALK
jgi:hypothetical protein